jgi:hypothetical protein
VLHNPARLRYVAVLALPLLAAAGLQGLADDPLPRARAWRWLAAGAAIWVGVPFLFGATPVRWILVGAAVLPAAWLLSRAARSARWAPAVVGLLAVELAIGAVWGTVADGDDLRTGLEGPSGGPLAFQPLRAPDVNAADYVRPTPFVAAIGGDRYVSWAPPAAAYEKGYLFAQEPTDWPALANERGTLFAIRDGLGYNPVQLPDYWRWIRGRNPLPIYYNASVLARPTTADLLALGVSYVVAPSGVPTPFEGDVVASADGYDLVRVAGAEGEPGVERVGDTEIVVDRPPGRTLVRESYDPGWRATTSDGRTLPLAPDGAGIGLDIPEGAGAVRLTYTDPWVMRGLALGALTWGLLVVAWAIAWARGRVLRPTPGDAAPPR